MGQTRTFYRQGHPRLALFSIACSVMYHILPLWTFSTYRNILGHLGHVGRASRYILVLVGHSDQIRSKHLLATFSFPLKIVATRKTFKHNTKLQYISSRKLLEGIRQSSTCQITLPDLQRSSNTHNWLYPRVQASV